MLSSFHCWGSRPASRVLSKHSTTQTPNFSSSVCYAAATKPCLFAQPLHSHEDARALDVSLGVGRGEMKVLLLHHCPGFWQSCPHFTGENNDRGSKGNEVTRPESREKRLLIHFPSLGHLVILTAWCVRGYGDKTRGVSERG